MTRRDHGAAGSVGHHPHATSRSPARGGQHRRREQPEGPGRGHGTRARNAGVPGAGTGRRADAPALCRPVRRGPARTRCSAHLRPVEHATSCQRVIGREAPGWQADSPLTGYPPVTDTSRLDGGSGQTRWCGPASPARLAYVATMTPYPAALAMGIRQSEALGLHWKYVDLDVGTIKVGWQLKRTRYRHGCADPVACTAGRHRVSCPRSCTTHRHRPDCSEGCTKRGHQCPEVKRPCPDRCTGHARECPQRVGGRWQFTRRKGVKPGRGEARARPSSSSPGQARW